MPWMMKKDGEKVCVYKKGANGQPEGEALHCYTGEGAEQKSRDYIKALYANADHASIPPSLRELQGESLDQKIQAIRDAFYRAFENRLYDVPASAPYSYIREIYDDYLIIEGGNKLYKVSYTVGSNGEIVFSERDKWQPVKITYAEQEEHAKSMMQQFFSLLRDLAETYAGKKDDGMMTAEAMKQQIDGMSEAQCVDMLKKMGKDPAGMSLSAMKAMLKGMADSEPMHAKMMKMMGAMMDEKMSEQEAWDKALAEFADHPWHEGRPGEVGGSSSSASGGGSEDDDAPIRAKSASARAEKATKKAMESGDPKDHAAARDENIKAAEENMKAYRATQKSNPKAAEGYKRAVIEHEQTAGIYDKRAGKYHINQAMDDFLFVELQVEDPATGRSNVELKAIDGLAAGTFVSMTGDEVTFDPADLQAYIDNTNRIIESTRTASGEIVGLPIDLNGHDHKGGAGWIKGLQLDKARNIIQFMVEWTKDGAQVIKENVRRFFSPSTDPNNKLILGGSLTNWPATRDNATGQILLRPVELSQSIKEIDMPNILEQMKAMIDEAVKGAQTPPTPASPTEPPAELDGENNPSIRDLLQTPEAVEELGKKAQEIAQASIRAEKRKLHVVEFASRMIGGTKEKPFGLRGIKPNELVALLLALPEKPARAVEKILEATLDSAIDFAQYGFDDGGYVQKPQLPEPLKRYAKEWVASGKPIEEFFKQNPEVGDPDNFNLSEFAPKEN